jgi:large subunit ribosomal protein L15
MPKSKVDRLRGKRTHGKGNTKNQRGAGSKGGSGRAGSFKHKFSKYFTMLGKRKLISPRLHAKVRVKTITLNDLNKYIVDKETIDLKEIGFGKILGTGNLNKPVKIKNAQVTKIAKEKIEKAGGVIE